MPRYKVVVDDNFHYQDPDERREQGVYETVEERSQFAVDLSISRSRRSTGPASRLNHFMIVTRASAMIRPSW
jgi:hypothetical protein